MKKRLFVDTETVLVGLLQVSGKDYVDFDQIDEFRSYVKRAIEADPHSGEYNNIVIDLDFNAVMRVVQIHSQLLGLEDERAYMKCMHSELPSLAEANPYLLRLIHDFIIKKGG